MFIKTTQNFFLWLKKSISTLKNKKKFWPLVAVLFFLLGLAKLDYFNPLVNIPPGHRGIYFNRIQRGFTEKTTSPGLHFHWPWELVYLANLSPQLTTLERVTADSLEFQDVTLNVSISFSLQEQNLKRIFDKLGTKSIYDISQEIIHPNAQEILKNIIVNYPIREILLKQEEIKEESIKRFSQFFSSYYLNIENVIIENILLAPSFRSLIAELEFAQEGKEKEALLLEQEKIRAERRIISAQTDQEVHKLEIEGLKNLSPEIIEYKKLGNQAQIIEKWDGKVPQNTNGPFLFE